MKSERVSPQPNLHANYVLAVTLVCVRVVVFRFLFRICVHLNQHKSTLSAQALSDTKTTGDSSRRMLVAEMSVLVLLEKAPDVLPRLS